MQRYSSTTLEYKYKHHLLTCDVSTEVVLCHQSEGQTHQPAFPEVCRSRAGDSLLGGKGEAEWSGLLLLLCGPALHCNYGGAHRPLVSSQGWQWSSYTAFFIHLLCGHVWFMSHPDWVTYPHSPSSYGVWHKLYIHTLHYIQMILFILIWCVSLCWERSQTFYSTDCYTALWCVLDCLDSQYYVFLS